MKQFLTLIRREWWEWRRVILWTIGVFTFLMLLTLIPLNKLSNTIDDSLECTTSQFGGVPYFV